MRNQFNYDIPFRPNYEKIAVMLWFITAAVFFWMYKFNNVGNYILYLAMSIFSLGMGLTWFPKMLMMSARLKKLEGTKLTFINTKQMFKKMKALQKKGNIWLGTGFRWERDHAQLSYEMLRNTQSAVLRTVDNERMGSAWIHGLNDEKDTDILFPINHSTLHTLILGTTGSGKTRMFDLLIAQAIFRKETVFIIDPKGDKELRENAKRACEAMGHPEKFMFFHPGFPDESCLIDPLANFNRPTELASRIAALISTETGSDPFQAFGQMALNNICQGMVMSHKRPTLITLRRYMEGGVDGLIITTIENYADKTLSYEWKSSVSEKLSRANNTFKKALVMVEFYTETIEPDHPNADVRGIITMFQHDREHFSKMIASLLPILSMLTAGDLSDLLSPNGNDPDETRIITNSSRMIESGQVVYIGLDSLSDSMVGTAIGSMLLADLASTAGDRYNYGEDLKPVNIYVDEAAEVLNDQLIQILNKGRGALMRVTLASQTIADFVTRLGSQEKADQVLGNVNNIIALRCIDNGTQEYLTENIPKTTITSRQVSIGSNTSGDPLYHGGSVGERLTDEEAEIFPPQLMGSLPNLEYIAKLSGNRVYKGVIPILEAN